MASIHSFRSAYSPSPASTFRPASSSSTFVDHGSATAANPSSFPILSSLLSSPEYLALIAKSPAYSRREEYATYSSRRKRASVPASVVGSVDELESIHEDQPVASTSGRGAWTALLEKERTRMSESLPDLPLQSPSRASTIRARTKAAVTRMGAATDRAEKVEQSPVDGELTREWEVISDAIIYPESTIASTPPPLPSKPQLKAYHSAPPILTPSAASRSVFSTFLRVAEADEPVLVSPVREREQKIAPSELQQEVVEATSPSTPAKERLGKARAVAAAASTKVGRQTKQALAPLVTRTRQALPFRRAGSEPTEYALGGGSEEVVSSESGSSPTRRRYPSLVLKAVARKVGSVIPPSRSASLGASPSPASFLPLPTPARSPSAVPQPPQGATSRSFSFGSIGRRRSRRSAIFVPEVTPRTDDERVPFPQTTDGNGPVLRRPRPVRTSSRDRLSSGWTDLGSRLSSIGNGNGWRPSRTTSLFDVPTAAPFAPRSQSPSQLSLPPETMLAPPQIERRFTLRQRQYPTYAERWEARVRSARMRLRIEGVGRWVRRNVVDRGGGGGARRES